jgi:hypothetical protein
VSGTPQDTENLDIANQCVTIRCWRDNYLSNNDEKGVSFSSCDRLLPQQWVICPKTNNTYSIRSQKNGKEVAIYANGNVYLED